jgi:hypothetical protein
MRYLVGLMCVLAGVVALPQSASAEAGEADTTSEPNLQEPAPEEPSAEVKLAPAAEYRKTQVRRAKIGLAASVIAFGGGVAMMGVGFAKLGPVICISFGGDRVCGQGPSWAIPVAVSGTMLTIGGLAGMIISGRSLANRKKQLRWYAGAPESRHRKPRRAQWDLARSRLVF